MVDSLCAIVGNTAYIFDTEIQSVVENYMVNELNLTNRDYWLCYRHNLSITTITQKVMVKMTDLDFWGKVHSGYYEAKFVSFDYTEYEIGLLEDLNNQKLTKSEYDAGFAKIEKTIKQLKQKHLKDYRDKQAELNLEFCKDCEIEFNFSDLPPEVKDFIHGKAYEDGHAYGFSGIAGQYEDLLHFAKICREAFVK